MLRQTEFCLARGINNMKKVRHGAPGAPTIMLKTSSGFRPQYRYHDMIVSYPHQRKDTDRLIHYLGKHVPHPQKSLWSPDTPQPMDKHMFKLTTLDIDAFKYYFGVQRAQVKREAWKVLWR